MAQIENPRKVFNFSISVVQIPIDPWLAQEVEIPEETVEAVAHGDTNHDIKTAGRKSYGNLKINKLLLASGSDNYFFDWMASCADVLLGGGLEPKLYKRTLIITELAENGASVINTWIATGCFPTRRSAITLNRLSSDNTIEEVELSIDTLEKV